MRARTPNEIAPSVLHSCTGARRGCLCDSAASLRSAASNWHADSVGSIYNFELQRHRVASP